MLPVRKSGGPGYYLVADSYIALFLTLLDMRRLGGCLWLTKDTCRRSSPSLTTRAEAPLVWHICWGSN